MKKFRGFEERILGDFSYHPNTGELIRIRKKIWGHWRPVYEVAGTKSHGYLQTHVACEEGGKRFFIHRIAWLFMTGSFPKKGMDIDHINGIKDDNRWRNLRLAKRGQNNMNSGNPSNNTTGQKGVHPTRGRWFARIKVDQKIIHLGVFKNFDDAVIARKKAEDKYFGEFRKGSR